MFLISAMDDLELVNMFLVSTMDDLEILYERKYQANNDTSLGLAKDPLMLKLAYTL